MHISQLKEFLKSILIKNYLPPVMLWGASGIGKSSVVHEVSQELGMELIDLRVSLLEPVDLMGLPVIKDGITSWNRPQFLPSEGKGVLFLDEINLGSREVLKALYQLLLDRQVGSYKLPDGWKIICAGNRSEDRASVTTMPDPLLKRLLHINVESTVEDFTTYLVNKVPGEGTKDVVSYLLWRPENLHRIGATSEGGSPTPRSWEWAARTLNDSSITKEMQPFVLSGLVSAEVAGELLEYIKQSQVIQPERLVKEPDTLKNLERSLKFAAIVSVVMAAKIQPAEKVSFLRKIDPEFGVLGVKLLYQMIGTKLLNVPGIKEWAAENKDILL